MIVLLILAFAGLALYEIPQLVRKKQIRDLVVFLSFFMLAFVLSGLQIVGVKLPNPLTVISNIVKLLGTYRFKP